MVTRIRKGVRPHVYLREWRKAKDVRAVDMAERLGIERESYYRLERDPSKLNLAELTELADALGIEPEQFWGPPEAPESVDTILRKGTPEQKDIVLGLAKRLMGRAS